MMLFTIVIITNTVFILHFITWVYLPFFVSILSYNFYLLVTYVCVIFFIRSCRPLRRKAVASGFFVFCFRTLSLVSPSLLVLVAF